MQITVKLNDAEVTKKLTRMEKDQLPFATALALTQTAAAMGTQITTRVKATMSIHKPWSSNFRQGRIGGQPPKSAAFSSIPANRKDAMYRMHATIGTIGWQMGQQIDDSKSLRKPKTAAFLWVPLQRNLRHNRSAMKRYQKQIMQPKKKGRVFINASRGKLKAHRLVYERSNNKRTPIRPLYVLMEQQEISPRLNFQKHVSTWGPKVFPLKFKKALERAVKSAK